MTSPAGGAASGAGDAGQQGDGDNGQSNGGPDIGALNETLSQVAQSQESMREYLASNPWQQQQAEPEADEGAGEQPAELDLSFLDEAGFDQQTVQGFADVVNKEVATQVDAAKREMQKEHQALDARLTQREQEEQMRDLVERFPDMLKPEVNQAIFKQTHDMCEAYGWPKAIADDPRMWGLTYMAQTSVTEAVNEGSEQPSAAHLEGGAGAGPAGSREPGYDYLQALTPKQGGRLPFP